MGNYDRLKHIAKPSFWMYVISHYLKSYEESYGAIGRLAAHGVGANIDSTASLKDPELISLGSNVRIGPGCCIWPWPAKVILRDNILLGPHVKIFASNHGIAKDELIREQDFCSKDVVIESDVWVGAGAIVLAGVTVGQGTVVAAGSVVTKDTPPYSVVAGIPAKVISQRS
jgi:maltose O-acetyltransferase